MFTKRPKEFWEEALREFIKIELKRRGISQKDFAKKLSKAGGKESQTSITNKLSRGTFRASFFVMTLAVLDIPTLDVGQVATLAYRLEKRGRMKTRARHSKTIKKSNLGLHRQYDEDGRLIGIRKIDEDLKKRVERSYLKPKS